MKPRHALLGLLVVCQFSQISTLQAATLTWDSNGGNAPTAYDGGGVWTAANNFFNGTANVTWVNGTDIAAFGNTASNPVGVGGAVTFTTGVTAGGLIFNPNFGNNGKYNLSGGTGGVLTLTGSPSIAVNTNSSRPFAAINGVLAGTSGFDVTTTTGGILEIGVQANTITGAIRLRNGASLSIGGDSSFGGANNGLTFSDASATLITRANTTPAAGRAFSISAGNTGRFDSLNGATLTLIPTGGISGAGSSLQKEGLGGLTLGTASSYTGETRVRQGTLTLNFASAAAPATNLINPASNLRLYGGAVAVVGKTLVSSSQNFASTLLDPGASSLSASAGASGSTVLNLGAITRNPGATLDVGVAADTSFITTSANTNGVLGGFATVGGADWATVSGGTLNVFTAYQTGTNATTWVAADNVTLAASPTVPLANDATINTLRVTAAANLAIPTGKTLTLATGGVLSTGTDASGISGGTLRGAASGGLTVIQNSASPLTISSVIANNGVASALTKSGMGELILTGPNLFSGNVFLNAGSLNVDGDATLGTGTAVTSRAGTTLTLAGTTAVSSSKSFLFDLGSDSLGANGLGGSATDVGNFNLNVTNPAGVTLSGGFQVTAGTLVKTGAGAVTLTGGGLHQLARLNGGMGIGVLEGTVNFNGGVGSEWRVGQAEFVIGLGNEATKEAARKAVVNVASGAITVGSWTGIGRGNGTTGLDSSLIMTGGSWDTGSISMGFGNGVVGYSTNPKLDLSGNSSFTVRSSSLLGESTGADATINLSDTAQYYSRFDIRLGSGASKATANLTDNAVFASGGYISIGNGNGGIATINISGNALLSVPTDLNVGNNDGSTGTINISSGQINVGNLLIGRGSNVAGDIITRGAVNQSGGIVQAGAGGDWRIGGANVNDPENYGSYVLSGGSLSSGGHNFQIGAYGKGVLDISGNAGLTSTGGYPVVARFAGGTGLLTVSGNGSITQTTMGALLIIGESGSAVMNLQSGNISLNSGLLAGLASDGSGTINLNGGNLRAPSISGGSGGSRIYFNGTQIKPSESRGDFIRGIGAAIIGPSGLKIDTAGLDVVAAQSFNIGFDSGLTAIAAGTGGSGYMGQPIVQITGGGGIGATAIATMSGDAVTGYIITNPGSGYASVPTITLVGGGATTAATPGAATIGSLATDGGIAKSGAGKLTLSGFNNYAGGTTIAGGVLAVGSGGALPSVGPVTVNGGNLDLGAYSAFIGDLIVQNGDVLGSGFLTGESFAVTNTTGTVTIVPSLSGFDAGLTKTGAGNLILAGANSFGGLTSISGGGTVSFGEAGSLDFSSSLAVTSSTLDLRNGTGTRLLEIDNLTLNNATIAVGLAGGVSDVLQVNGTTTASGTNVIKIIGTASPGGYDVIKASGSLPGTFTLDTSGAIAGFTTYSGAKVGSSYRITAAGNATPGESWWKGDINAVWTDISQAPSNSNWATSQAGGTDTKQLPGASTNVHFSAAGAANTATTLGASLIIKSLTFDSGTASVTGGTNQLTIIGTNVDGHALQVLSGANGGINSNMSYSGSTAVATGGTLTFTGGSLGDVTDEIIVDGTLNVNADLAKGLLSGSGTISKSITGTSTFSTGDALSISTFSGKIQNATGTLGFTKTGGSKLTLNGTANTFSGNLTIAGGTLEIATAGALINPGTVIQQSGTTFVNSVGNYTFNAPYGLDLNGAPSISVNEQGGIAYGDGNFILQLAAGTTEFAGPILNNGGSVAKRGPGTMLVTTSGTSLLAGSPEVSFAIQEGHVVLNGGATATYIINGELAVGDNTPNATSVTLSSGTLNVGSYLSAGRGTGTTGIQNTVNLNGGTLNVPNLFTGYSNGLLDYNARPVINVNGSTVNVSEVRIGESAGSRGTLNLMSGALTATGTMQVGYGATGIATNNMPISVGNLQVGAAGNGVGAFYNNSTVTGTGGASINNFALGNGSNSYGYFRNNPGSSAIFAEAGVGGGGGNGTGNAGVMDIAGGTFTVTTWFTPSRGGADQSSLINVTGGTLKTPDSGQFFANFSANENKLTQIEVSGGGSIIGSGASSAMNLNNSTGNNYGLLTLRTGGTVQLTSVTSAGDAGHAIVNFNGGTLKAGATAPALLGDTVVGYLHGGGATVDTNSFDATIAAPMLAPQNAGISTIALASNGVGYLGRPLVRITGDGVGATAVADYNPATGAVTGITITNPGSGYNTLPTVALVGGGAATPAVVGAVTVAAVATNGVLTKVGSGTLTLAGQNTYTGNTAVNVGGVTLAEGAQLKFVIGANNVSNTISGSGVLTLNGNFLIDTAGANLTNGNSWTLVQVSTLTESYGPTFSVVGFTESGDVWTKTEGSNTWTFSEATGMLTLSTGGGGSAYNTWATNNGLTASNNGPTQDPDFDGVPNVLEFVLGGNPLASSTQVLPKLAVTPTAFVYTFKRSDASEAEVALHFEWGTTLATWPNTSAVSAANSGPDAKGVTIGVVENGAAPDDITVTVPRTNAVNGKIFGRLRAVK